MIAFVAAQVMAALPEIAIRPLGNGYRAEAATFDFWQSTAVFTEIERRAAELCRDKEVKWGNFASVTELGMDPGAAPPKISGYFQEFSCSTRAKRIYEPAPPDWKPSASDEADVRRYFETYYKRRDRGDFQAAFAMFKPDVLGDASGWAEQMRTSNTKLGAGKRRVTGVTWYVNPQGADHPGVYAAVDFVGEFPSMHVYCGYLVLYRIGPGSYEITREEQNFFERGAEGANPEQVAQMRAASCRG